LPAARCLEKVKALLEVFTNPDVLALLAAAVPIRQAPPPANMHAAGSERPRLLSAAKEWVIGQARAAATMGRQMAARLKAGLLGLWRLRRQLLSAVAIGAAVGLAAYLAGPWLSALAGGLASGTLSLTAPARGWLQRPLLASGLADGTA
jgi:hypothetical protein